MKRLTLKARLTLWYGTSLVLLVLLISLVSLLIAGAQTERTTRTLLVNSVVDASYEIEFEYGLLDIYDDDILYYRDNIYLSVYDSKGQQLGGFTPGAIALPATQQGNVRLLKLGGQRWLLYDMLTVIPSFGSIWIRGCTSLTLAQQSIFNTIKILAIIAPAFIIAALLGGYLIIRRSIRPLSLVEQTARSIKSGRDLSQRIALESGSDEVVSLANTFNDMFDALQRAFESESQFTADASHELRTPIAVILAQSEDALCDMNNSEQALKVIHDQAAHMSAMLNQLLLLAKGDNGTAVMHRELLNISELLEVIIEALQTDKLSLSCNIEPDIMYNGDETMLMRLATNLIENAISYTDAGGRVEVSLHSTPSSVVFAVKDNGIGIDESHLEDIFKRFYRIDGSHSSTGTGLGLPMARFIAACHGGELTVESKLNHGSTFTVTLPRQ